MTFKVLPTHNMCTLQLDPRFEGLQHIMEYVSQNKATTFVKKYDQHVLLPLLVVVCKHLNLGDVEGPPPLAPINVDSLWGVATSIEEANISLVKYKRSLHHQIQADNNNVKSPLQWWKDHAN
jgi:hypothetical protein